MPTVSYELIVHRIMSATSHRCTLELNRRLDQTPFITCPYTIHSPHPSRAHMLLILLCSCAPVKDMDTGQALLDNLIARISKVESAMDAQQLQCRMGMFLPDTIVITSLRCSFSPLMTYHGRCHLGACRIRLHLFCFQSTLAHTACNNCECTVPSVFTRTATNTSTHAPLTIKHTLTVPFEQFLLRLSAVHVPRFFP